MVSAAPAKLVKPLQRRRTMLHEKAKVRDNKKMAKKLPAGSGALTNVPKGKDFTTMATIGKTQTNITAYCKAIRSSTETFKDAHRATSTAMEHDAYMRLINSWAERSGFGTYVVAREGVAKNTPPCVKARLKDLFPLLLTSPKGLICR